MVDINGNLNIIYFIYYYFRIILKRTKKKYVSSLIEGHNQLPESLEEKITLCHANGSGLTPLQDKNKLVKVGHVDK